MTDKPAKPGPAKQGTDTPPDADDILADLNRVEGLLDAMTPANRRMAGELRNEMKRELAFFKYLHPRLKNTECVVFLNAMQVQQHHRYLHKGERPPMTIVAAAEAAEHAAAQAEEARAAASTAASASSAAICHWFGNWRCLGSVRFVALSSTDAGGFSGGSGIGLATSAGSPAWRGVILADDLSAVLRTEVIAQRHADLDVAEAAVAQSHRDAAEKILNDWPSALQSIDDEFCSAKRLCERNWLHLRPCQTAVILRQTNR